MNPSQAFQAFLDQQKLDFKLTLPGKLDRIHLLWADVRAGTGLPEASIELERLAHSMGGSCGTFGFADIGNRAGELEALIGQARLQEHPLSEALQLDIERSIAAIEQGVNAA
jgi:HPt (histidine-containing phosphotransfer) domain-containing protein